MLENRDKLKVTTFDLYSSSDVSSIITQCDAIKSERLLIHIVSYIHNTVLVQTLKKELEKKFPISTIALLKHTDKTKTSLHIYAVEGIEEESFEEVALSEFVIDALYNNFLTKEKSEKSFRENLFSRYFTDNLTNLPNIYQLRKDLQHDETQGLVVVKIDNFVTINNFYGFVIGDYVIEEIAKYLKNSVDEKVYRLSGAEFAFTMKSAKNFYDLKEYLHKLYEKMKNCSVLYQDSNIFIDLTLASTASSANKDIFSKVSMALKYAQKQRIPFWIYEDRMNFEDDYKQNLKLSNIVRDAVQKSNIVPYFQAIIDNRSGKIVKYECLARLIDNDENILAPALFIPIAKKIKVYTQITMQMIDKSFGAFENSSYEFSVNLSIEDIMNSEIYNYIINKLRDSQAANRVTFEILESEAIEDFDKLEKFVNESKRYGAKIAIDDFGSGYSNFSYLIKLKANYIKIDGSLIEDIDVNEASLLVVETIVRFAKKLGMKTIAEYVHSSVVMNKVKELGIDFSQGFYIDKGSLESNP